MGDFELCQSHHGVSFCSEWVGLETQAKAAQGDEASHKLFFPRFGGLGLVASG